MKKLTEREKKQFRKTLDDVLVNLENIKCVPSERCYVIRISDYDAIIQRERRIAKEEAAKAFLAMIDPECEVCDAKRHEGCYCIREKIKAKLKKYMEE